MEHLTGKCVLQDSVGLLHTYENADRSESFDYYYCEVHMQDSRKDDCSCKLRYIWGIRLQYDILQRSNVPALLRSSWQPYFQGWHWLQLFETSLKYQFHQDSASTFDKTSSMQLSAWRMDTKVTNWHSPCVNVTNFGDKLGQQQGGFNTRFSLTWSIVKASTVGRFDEGNTNPWSRSLLTADNQEEGSTSKCLPAWISHITCPQHLADCCNSFSIRRNRCCVDYNNELSIIYINEPHPNLQGNEESNDPHKCRHRHIHTIM